MKALAVTRGPSRNPDPAVTCMFCSRAGHTAATCREYRLVKRNPKENGRRSDSGNDRGNGNGRRKNRAASKAGKNGATSEDDDKKTVRSGCYFCEGPHKATECPNCPKATSTSTTGSLKLGGMFADLKTDSASGVRLRTSLGTGTALTAKVITPQPPHADEFWAGDSGASESMTADDTGFEDYERAPPGDRVESAGGKFLPVAGYGRLSLLVDQGNGNFRSETQQLTLERVAHVPELGHHNLISAKALAKTLDAPMRVYPAAAVTRPRHGGKSLTFKTLRRDNGLFEIKARRCAVIQREREKPAPAKSLVAARRNTRDIMEFHQLLGHPSEDITRGTARTVGLRLTGAWSPCVQCFEAIVRRYAVPKITESRADRRAG